MDFFSEHREAEWPLRRPTVIWACRARAMKTSLFSFDLPGDLIASAPPKRRGESRLMLLDRSIDGPAAVRHLKMRDLPKLIESGTIMVFNDTRVRKARMFAENRLTGGKSEFLFLRPSTDGCWDCIVDKARKKKPGTQWLFPGGITGTIVGEPAGDRRILSLDPLPDEHWFETHGHIPLPPYIRRPDTPDDARRYQTVYAREIGSAAAPTAGLHFTDELLESLKEKGVHIAWVTLHVGLGTFSPVRSENIEDHPMHYESYAVPVDTVEEVNKAKKEGRPVLAVGTTAVRTLEAAWENGKLKPGEGRTNLFIYPGYRFQVVDKIFTNFHTPESSLLMLVSAFYGREKILEAYRIAMEEKYRFFSYGDAMLIL